MHKNPFDVAWEEKTEKTKIFRDFEVSFWALDLKTQTRKLRKKKHYDTVIWKCSFKTVGILFKWRRTQNNLNRIADYVAGICLLKTSDPSKFIKLSLFLFMSLLTLRKLITVMKKQIHMHSSFITQKIKIFRDFQVFVLSLIPKNENSGITEILQKRHNTERGECSFKNNWNTVQTTPFSKWFSHIAHAAGIWVLKAFDPSGYIKLNPFLFMSVLALKQLK